MADQKSYLEMALTGDTSRAPAPTRDPNNLPQVPTPASTSQTYPMFDPEGQIRQIPQDQIQNALQGGGKMAVRMTDPQGQVRYVPHDSVQDAMRAGGKIAPEEEQDRGSVIKSFFSSLIPGGPAYSPYPGMDLEAKQQAAQAAVQADKLRKQEGHGLAYRIAAGSPIGLLANAPGMEQAAREGKPRDVIGIAGAGMAQTAPMAAHAVGLKMPSFTKTPEAAAAEKMAPRQEALTSLLADNVKNTDPHQVAGQAIQPLRETAARMGVTEETFKGREGARKGVEIADQAQKEHNGQVAQIMKPYPEAQVSGGGAPIGNEIRGEITQEMRNSKDPVVQAQVRRLDTQAASYDRPLTLGELNEMRIRLAKENQAMMQKSLTGQITSPIRQQAAAAAYRGARNLFYEKLGEVSGIPPEEIQGLKATEGHLIEARNALENEYNKASGAQAEAVSKSFKEKVAGTRPTRYGVEHGLIKEFIGPKPVEVLNSRLKKIFGDLPGAESVPQRSIEGGQLKPPAGPDIKLGPGAEGMTGISRSLNINGKPVGHISYELSGDTLTVNHIGGPEQNYNAVSNQLGQKGVIEVARQLQQAHPEIKYIQGIRVGGARGMEGRSVRVPIQALLRGSEKLKAPVAPASPSTPPVKTSAPLSQLTGASRQAATTAIMLAAKNGEISAQEADQRIKQLVGSQRR